MPSTTRQNNLLVNQDWTKIYESFRNADFQSYDYQTLRKSMIDYLQIYFPEDFNDFIESSEYVALIDLIAYLGQSLAFRTDLNARENFIDTAERRDSVLKLAKLISYIPKRNQTATGYLKFDSVQTTQTLIDSNGTDLTNLIVKWNDSANVNWYEQFITILNGALPSNQQVGRSANTKTIAGIVNEEYNINLPANNLPIFKYNAQIETVSLGFEVVSPTSANQNYIYEVPPAPGRPLNILYKNDNLGNASNSTGFFFYFKQGNLQSQDFAITESIPNNLVNINFDNINNTDVWLWELTNTGTPNIIWSQLPTVVGTNIIYNNNAVKKSYQASSRGNDQVDLIFGDGTFAAIPQGNFRTYFRTSTGLTYKITPDEMQNIRINIPYISKTGRSETLSVVASLKYTIANAVSRESVNDIRTKAPQLYYTQNRMVTGEDYNIFPYANFNTVSKVKAVNRTSSGVSRYLDIIDTTGRYSSTNIFAQDGILFEEDNTTSFSFTWSTTADINREIQNQIIPIIETKSLMHYYYANYNRFDLTNLNVSWYKQTAGSSSSTGWFVNSSGVAQQIGAGVSGNLSYATENSIIVFSPGTGNYFDAQNNILTLPASGVLPQNGKSLLYVSITRLVGNGGQGVLTTGFGPVALSENIPTGAIATTVIPAWSNSFTTAFTTQLISLISSYTEFGIRYDQNTRTWQIISAQDIDLNGAFSQANQGSLSGQGLDSSWLLAFTVNGTLYSVISRGLNYVFASVRETKFYFDNQLKVFDPITGRTVNDEINILKVNGDPDTGTILTENLPWFIYSQATESDGYVDQGKVYITFSDVNDDGVPDNPDIFTTIVQPNINPLTKHVFFEKSYGYESFVTFTPVDSTLVNINFPTKAAILPNINNYLVGQIFYATSEDLFYVLTVTNNVYSLVQNSNYLAKVGRSNLYFQYRHNAPGNRRLDPSPNNLIDIYLLTKEYEADYRAWALDTTGTIPQPERLTSESLRLEFNDLENYKSVSDAIIYNSAQFKLLFGKKSKPELQATFKVVKNTNINLSDTEIRSQVLAYINSFFQTANWDFGETFYFTELATYIQQALAPNISSIVIVPNSQSQVYGSLQQIGSEANEIFLSCATVENIEVITAITAAQLNLQSTAVNTIIT
jgi:hypothetical protein